MSSAGEFAFNTPIADNASSDIRTRMRSILECIESIDTSVQSLSEGWEGTEYDSHLDLVGQWQSAAGSIGGLLGKIAETLDSINDGNTELRKEVLNALNEMS